LLLLVTIFDSELLGAQRAALHVPGLSNYP
jgi:hypothetical protein